MRYSILLIAFCFLSCKKKSDSEKPVVNISSPALYSDFEIYDDIRVKGSVAEETELVSVSIELLDVGFNSAGPRVSIPVTSNGFDFDKYFELDDIHLQGGRYYIKVIAFDGFNEGSDYVEINIAGIPKQLTHLFVVTEPYADTTTWYSYDGSFSLFETFASENGGAIANSYHQYILQAGKDENGIIAKDPIFLDTLWDHSNLGLGGDYFRNIQLGVDNLSYASREDGKLVGYTRSGSSSISISSSFGYTPEDFYIEADKILIENKTNSGNNRLMRWHYKSSGTFIQSFVLNGDFVGITVHDEDEYFIAVNENNQGHIYLFNNITNSFWEPGLLNTGEVNDIFQISPDKILFTHTDGIFTYNYSNNTFLHPHSGNNLKNLVFDEVGNKLICSEGNDLFFFDLTGNLIGSASHLEPIKNVLLLYNK